MSAVGGLPKKGEYFIVQDIKLGIFSWFGFVMPFQEMLELIKKAGFDATCIWWEDEEGPRTLRKYEMAKIVGDSGLIIDNIHAPFCASNDLWSESQLARKEIIKKHTTWIEDCAKYRIPIMVMHLTEGEETPGPNKYGIESMLLLSKVAEDLGVKIAVENTRREDNVPFVLSKIPSAHLGFCFDSSHANLGQRVDALLLREYGERLITTHLSDNDGMVDRHWIPGNGRIDWKRLGELFPSRSYRGSLTLEVCPKWNKTPEEFLAKAFGSASRVRDIFFKEFI